MGIFIDTMIKLKDLLSENDSEETDFSQSSNVVQTEVGPNQHDVQTVGNQEVFITNLRRDVVNIELKLTNGVVFVTVK